RWNPKPEQIRILEAIFNSGIINPPRDEIRKIRVQLQTYGQVGDANVFYWFQNRKSRSKHKQRQLIPTNKSRLPPTTTAPPPIAPTASGAPPASSSSSSSSDKSSTHNPNSEKALPPTTRVIDLLSGSNNSVQAPGEFSTEPSLFLTGQQNNGGLASISTSIGLTQGFCFPHDDDPCVADVHHQNVGNCSSGLLGELMLTSHHCPSKRDEDDEKMKMQHHSIFSPSPNVNLSPTNYHVFQGKFASFDNISFCIIHLRNAWLIKLRILN
ncbi:wuschel-related homeobox 9, partial [Phtheirospermum japonicum]